MHKSSLDKMEKFVQKYLHTGKELNILDIGSQNINGTYKQFITSDKWSYTGADMVAGDNVDIVLTDVYKWKNIPSASYDVVISGQAFEHIEFFWVTMYEISRILKPDGICCIIAPSGGFEHRYPVDCWRFYPDGFHALARYAKLQPIEVYTQWEDDEDEGSSMWHDSVLIARKPIYGLKDSFSFWLKRKMQYLILPKEIRNAHM